MSWRARGHECDGLTAPADDREGFAAIIGSGAVVGEITVGGTVAVFSPAWRSGIFGAFAYVALRSGCPPDAGAWSTSDGSVELSRRRPRSGGPGRALIAYPLRSPITDLP